VDHGYQRPTGVNCPEVIFNNISIVFKHYHNSIDHNDGTRVYRSVPLDITVYVAEGTYSVCSFLNKEIKHIYLM